MPTLKLKYLKTTNKGPVRNRRLRKKDFDKFSPDLLGLGDLTQDGRMINALAAMFDLEGFTSFCNQIDAHLVIPKFTRQFLMWTFDCLRGEFIHESLVDKLNSMQAEDEVVVYGALPFFAKYMGDGMLLLWNTDLTGPAGILNIISSLKNISIKYHETFYSEQSSYFPTMPKELRCGIARGQIIGFQSASDYVGPCINVAARLQKMPGITFAVAQKGLDIESFIHKKNYVSTVVNIRGISDKERVLIMKEEFAALGQEDKKQYTSPKHFE